MLLSLQPGLPLLFFISVLLRAPAQSAALVVVAAVFSPFMAMATTLFLLTRSAKQLDRSARQAQLTFALPGFARQKTVPLPDPVVVRLSSDWGDDDQPALWFRVQVGDRKELGFCAAWQYLVARPFAEQLAGFLSGKVVDLVSADHRTKARNAAPHKPAEQLT